jgi:plastocyanin
VEPELFYWIGGALTLAALVVSAVGLKSDKFPPNNKALFGLIAVFAFLVVGSTTYAVVNARDEQEKHLAELEEEQEEADSEALAAGESGTEGPVTGEESAGGASVDQTDEEGQQESGGEDVTEGAPTDPASVDDGTVAMTEYAFGPDSVTVAQGDTITAENEGAVVHNLTIVDGEEELDGTEDVDGGSSADLKVDLDPGTYEMICTIPGHEDLGMAGEITVE